MVMLSTNEEKPVCAIEIDREARSALGAIGGLMGYPEVGVTDKAVAINDSLARLFPKAAYELAQWAKAFEATSVRDMRESWIHAFDLAPRCTPYVSVHLFGTERLARARLRAALA